MYFVEQSENHSKENRGKFQKYNTKNKTIIKRDLN